jgi:hypothetical protein
LAGQESSKESPIRNGFSTNSLGRPFRSWIARSTSFAAWRTAGKKRQNCVPISNPFVAVLRKWKPDCKFLYYKNLKEIQIINTFVFVSFPRKPNIFDSFMTMNEKYTHNLEGLVQERTDQLVEEKKKTEALLHRVLPK